ncbi:spatacsin isoform X1 [Phyllostomus hastatus]|uniref:spatacsin isoform X1 n=3 Tax=Phyllostomus hastatus TaxID=9423 RepID=UPI001E680E24|nr:spatacsin isoform X1 [Phyllostomus hastatus]
MAAEKWPGSAAAGGSCNAEERERVLPMLLLPVPAEATGRLGTWAQLHREQEVLGSLTAAGSLQVLSLAPGGRGGGGCSLDGPFRQFVWEDSHNSSTPTERPRLLALSENYELLIYEFNLKDGRCDGTILYSCSEEILQKLIKDQNISISLLSLRILSFHNNTSLLFINKFIILHIMFPEKDAEIRVLNYFTLPLPAQAVDSIIDTQLCRGILFVLSSLGWIYIFDIVDGVHVAHVDLALHQEDMCNEQQQEPAKISSFTSLKVSQDLEVAVIISSSNSAIALNLNLYFRQHPGHLLCEKILEDDPIEGPKGIDEDDPVNSDYNMKLTKFSFQVDRSWKAQLLSLNETINSSKLEVSHYAPWFQDILHLEPPESNNHCPSVPVWAFIPQDMMRSQYNFSQKDHAKTSDPERAWKRMCISEQEEPIELRCVSVTGFTALFTWAVEKTGWTIILWDLETEGMQCFCLGKKCIPIDNSGDPQLCLALTENGLSLILFGLTQEEFLNRLMIHGNASTVDSLCHLNGWGRCSIPIHALEAGIENRQLDTVNFFLKSKENLLNPSSKSPLPDQFDQFPSHLYLRNVQELTPALDLLCSAIRESDSETQSKNFSEQLLNLTLSFLNKQIRELFIQNEELDEYLQKGVNILTSYINELRTFMIKFPWKLTDAVDEYDVNENVLKVKESNIWEKLSIEEVIANAILNNKIPEAQTFFRINSHSAQRLEELIRIGLDLVFDNLKKNNVKEASELLKNMGFDVKDQLLKICFYTTDKNIRDFLVEILKEKKYFSEKEKSTIDFVHQVEKFYSEYLQENMQIQSFPRYWMKEQDFFKHKSALDSFLKYDYIDKFDKQNHTIALNWAQWWNQLTQESILLPRINPEEYKSYSSEALWRYFTARHDWLSIISWIGEFQTQNNCSSLQQNKWPPLTVDVIDQNTCCNNNMRNKIIDELARNGIFLISELEDFELFLLRLNRIGGVMQDALPVQNYRSKEGWDFHSHFILYCLEHSLQYLLYVYLDCYKLSPPNCPFLDKKELHEDHPWFEFLVQCRQVSSNLTDPKLIFQASLANAQILIPSNQASVSSMLLEGHTLLALATTMYAPGGVSLVVQNEENENCLKKVDPQLLKMALTPYPKLKTALFPQYAAPSVLPPDITLYHLMQSLLPFDPSRLFGWQSANTLAIGDASSHLPHFSSPDLVNKYAIVERLNFAYYLYHGRPSFAFGTFLVQELTKSKTPKQLIQQVGNEAYVLGLSSFHVPSIGAACVCFLELLGLDSLKLRVDMKVANIILNYRCTNEDAQYSFIRESLAEKLSKLAEDERAAVEELLVLLEEGIWNNVQQEEIKRLSNESSSHWTLVVQFCRLHNVKLSTAYLRECARANDWLQFIIHSQLHNYHPEEVKSLLQYFSPVFQDHLRLAFENLPPVSNSSMDSDQVCNKCPQELQRHKEEIIDFFEILFRCSKEPNSWCWLLAEAVKQQAPILSVLASCLQDASSIPCLCVWIITSVEDSVAAEAMGHIQGSVEGHTWDLEDLSVIWRTLLRRQKSKTLIRGFQLFFKDSPLLLMMEMYELCMFFKNYKEAQAKLLEFQKTLETLETAAIKVHAAIPVPWLKEQVCFLLKLMLQQCRTQYELGKLLQLFVAIEHLFSDGPDIKKLCVLSQILKDTSVTINHAIITSYSLENFQHECRFILEKLETNGQFASARRVAELAELPVDNLVIEEITQEMQTLKHIDQWSLKQARIDFWKKCHENFKKNSISSKAASSFFSAQALVACEYPNEEGQSNTEECHLLLTLAGHWLAQEDLVPVEKLEELEKQIWLCRITQHTLRGNQEEIEPRFSQQISTSGELPFDGLASEFSFSKLAALNTSKYLELNGLPSKETCENRLDWKEQESLNFLIGRLLDDGCVHEASRVCRYFRFYNQDVALVLHCRALASGEASVDDLHTEIHALLQSAELLEEEKEPNIPLRKAPSTSSLDSQSFVMLPPSDEVVTNLEILTSRCLHGKNYCRRVLCLYELSKELGCSYTDVATQDGEAMLRTILASQRPDRCKRAQAFISTQGLEPDRVAELVAEEVTRELLSQSEGTGHKQMVTPAEESQAFLQLTALCQDRTLVGMKLLEKISSVPHGELSCTTELLILAHHCFTLTCHMEGIIRVLQAARLLTDDHLAPNEEYGLVVRLLTGIGRYNEMTYIFELLHKKHYFEVLMRKKLDPSGTLKTALLDYIKRCRPGDSEKHNMIALCFSMCREIGENHEAAACIQLKLIESQPWEDNLKDGHQLKQLLLKALTLMLDAAESYAKDSCVRQALHCHRLTRLLTLQIHFLNTGQNTMLINLGRHRLMDCIMSLSRFYQASIVAEAYDFVPDWAEILYQQVILKGDFNYLEEFKQQRLLRTSIFEEISEKVKQRQPTEMAVKNLKKLLTCCEDVYLYYKLAYEHKFYDVVNMLLKDPQTGCCLKDMLAG